MQAVSVLAEIMYVVSVHCLLTMADRCPAVTMHALTSPETSGAGGGRPCPQLDTLLDMLHASFFVVYYLSLTLTLIHILPLLDMMIFPLHIWRKHACVSLYSYY